MTIQYYYYFLLIEILYYIKYYINILKKFIFLNKTVTPYYSKSSTA